MLPLVVVLALVPTASQKWVALVHLSSDVPSSWSKPLQESAEANKQSTQWAPPPQVTLDEAQLALGCAGWGNACAGQIAGMTGAVTALVVDVISKDGGVLVTVKAVKANGSMLGAEDKIELPGKTDKDLEMARDFVKASPKGQKMAYLVVDTDIAGADVSIDGEKKGKTRFQEMLSPGEHKLQITAEGKAPIQKTVTLKAGQLTSEILSLSAAGPPVETTTPVGNAVVDHEVNTTPAVPSTPAPAASGASSTVGWSLAVGGGAFAVIAGVFAGGAVYDRFYNRVNCGPGPSPCVPNVPLLFGLYAKGKDRARFRSDSSAWIGGSVATAGVGALLGGTGIVIATGAE